MDIVQFCKLSEKLDRIIELLEKIQPVQVYNSTGIVDFGKLTSNWQYEPEPDRSSSAVESDS